MSDTIVWVSGATGGLGLGLARNTPYAGARIINISRRQHPDYETVVADLTQPAGWETVRAHFKAELANFKGKRAIFIHNAKYMDAVGLIGKVDEADFQGAVMVDACSPLILGAAFLRASSHLDCEAGLVLISGGTVRPVVGLATYAAGKSGAEYWAEVVRNELALTGDKRWVVAFLPGVVDSPGTRKNQELDPDRWPWVTTRRTMQARDIDTAAQIIWRGLPPPPGVSLMSVSAEPAPPSDVRGPFGPIAYVS